MKIIWTSRAASDLDEAVDYISRDKPMAALGVADRIYSEIMKLKSAPTIGRSGRTAGTRELVFHPWQYVAVYRVTPDAIRIVRIRHTSRR